VTKETTMTDPTKPSARTGRKFLSLAPDQVAALEALGKQYGATSDVMAGFLRAALKPDRIKDLVTDHLTGATTKNV
jgi:hypothetical protein